MRAELIRLLTEYGWRSEDYASMTDEQLIERLEYTLVMYFNTY
jgi:hypothetical protein